MSSVALSNDVRKANRVAKVSQEEKKVKSGSSPVAPFENRDISTAAGTSSNLLYKYVNPGYVEGKELEKRKANLEEVNTRPESFLQKAYTDAESFVEKNLNAMRKKVPEISEDKAVKIAFANCVCRKIWEIGLISFKAKMEGQESVVCVPKEIVNKGTNIDPSKKEINLSFVKILENLNAYVNNSQLKADFDREQMLESGCVKEVEKKVIKSVDDSFAEISEEAALIAPKDWCDGQVILKNDVFKTLVAMCVKSFVAYHDIEKVAASSAKYKELFAEYPATSQQVEEMTVENMDYDSWFGRL
jgi:hypothetical protein